MRSFDHNWTVSERDEYYRVMREEEAAIHRKAAFWETAALISVAICVTALIALMLMTAVAIQGVN